MKRPSISSRRKSLRRSRKESFSQGGDVHISVIPSDPPLTISDNNLNECGQQQQRSLQSQQNQILSGSIYGSGVAGLDLNLFNSNNPSNTSRKSGQSRQSKSRSHYRRQNDPRRKETFERLIYGGGDDDNDSDHYLIQMVQKYFEYNVYETTLSLGNSSAFWYHDKVIILSEKSLFLFDRESSLRCVSIWLTNWRWFENFILLIILLNSLTLALYDYEDRDSETNRNQTLDRVGQAFTIVFTLEAGLDIIAQGLILHPTSYLRSGWGFLDFIVVISGLMEFFTDSVKLKSLRVLRALRPLRSITSIESLKKLVTALIRSLPEFVNVGIFLIYILILFAILGTHQYNGVFHNQCRLTSSPLLSSNSSNIWPIDENVQNLCTQSGAGIFSCPNNEVCGNLADYGLPIDSDNEITRKYMYYGIHNFDNIWQSLLVVFQIVTGESWSSYMYNLMDVEEPIFAGVFCIFLVMFGSFFLMNLVLAVIIQSFLDMAMEEIQEKWKTKNALIQDISKQKRKRKKIAEMLSQASINPVSDRQSNGENTNKNRIENDRSKNATKCLRKHKADEQKGQVNKEQDLTLPAAAAFNIKIQEVGKTANQGQERELFNKNQATIADPNASTILHESPIKQQQEEEANNAQKKKKHLANCNNGERLSSQSKHQKGEDDEEEEERTVNKSKEEVNSMQVCYDEEEEEQKKMEANIEPGKQLHEQFPYMKDQISFFRNYRISQLRLVSYYRNEIQKVKKCKIKLVKEHREEKLTERNQQHTLFRFCFAIISNNVFKGFILFCIVGNIVALAFDRYPEDQERKSIIEKLNIAFSTAFIVELLLKTTGLGYKEYLIDNYNKFDCIVVLASIVDFFIYSFSNIQTRGVVTLMRGFRLMRAFKMARHWPALENLLKTIKRTLRDISSFSLLLFLFMFTFALLGMELFAYRMQFHLNDLVDSDGDGKAPNSNFDNLLNAFTTVFVVMSAESWSTIYFNHYRAVQNIGTTFYFIGLIILGQRILMNLFLAILLQNFDEEMQKQQDKELQEKKEKDQRQSQLAIEKAQSLDFTQQVLEIQKERSSCGKRALAWLKNRLSDNNAAGLQMASYGKVVQIQASIDDPNQSNDFNDVSDKAAGSNSVRSPSQPLIKSRKTYINKALNYIVTLAIILSSIQLALDTPLRDPHSNYKNILFNIDLGTTIIFGVECIYKIYQKGFIFNGKKSYIRSPWHILDSVIIIFSILALSPLSDNFRIFKMFRILRILRLIGKNESLKIGVKALFYALPNVFNVTIILMFFLMIFGVVTVSFFKGQFFKCQTEHLKSIKFAENIEDKWDCLSFGGEWTLKGLNFDNIFSAIGGLFVMATGDMWADMMYFCASVQGVNLVQSQLSSPIWLVFFIFFYIVCSLFLMNLFVGVVVSVFDNEQIKQSGADIITEKQKEWIDAQLLVIKSEPIPKRQQPQNTVRAFFFKIQEHNIYNKYFINGCIVLNTLVLTLKWYEQPAQLDYVTDIINYIFTIIFFVEIIIKMLAYGFAGFFHQNWNVFDLVVVLASLTSIALSYSETINLKGAVTIIRAIRILRVVRLIKRFKSLNMIFNTFIVSLPGLMNIGGLLMIIVYFYSILGMQLFGRVMHNGLIDRNLNFETFTNSFTALWAVATGDNWSDIMLSCVQKYTLQFQCIENPTYEDYVANDFRSIGCGSGFEGRIFFYSFYLLVNLIFLNLFIAIILQGFRDTLIQDQRLFSSKNLRKFQDVWAEYDPNATTFVSLKELREILRFPTDLGFPVGIQGDIEEEDKFIVGLDLIVFEGQKFQFLNVINQLSLRSLTEQYLRDKRGKELKRLDTVKTEDTDPSFKRQEFDQDEVNKGKYELLSQLERFIEDHEKELARIPDYSQAHLIHNLKTFIKLVKKKVPIEVKGGEVLEMKLNRMGLFLFKKYGGGGTTSQDGRQIDCETPKDSVSGSSGTVGGPGFFKFGNFLSRTNKSGGGGRAEAEAEETKEHLSEKKQSLEGDRYLLSIQPGALPLKKASAEIKLKGLLKKKNSSLIAEEGDQSSSQNSSLQFMVKRQLSAQPPLIEMKFGMAERPLHDEQSPALRDNRIQSPDLKEDPGPEYDTSMEILIPQRQSVRPNLKGSTKKNSNLMMKEYDVGDGHFFSAEWAVGEADREESERSSVRGNDDECWDKGGPHHYE